MVNLIKEHIVCGQCKRNLKELGQCVMSPTLEKDKRYLCPECAFKEITQIKGQN